MIAEVKERLNIKELAIPSPDRALELRFDPMLDIPNDEWESLKKDLPKYSDSTSYIMMAGKIGYLDSGKAKELWESLSEDQINLHRGNLKRIKSSYLFNDKVATDITLPKPYFFALKFFPKGDMVLSGRDEICKRTKENFNLVTVRDLFYPLLLFPDLLKDADTEPKIAEKLDSQISEEKLRLANARESQNWEKFASAAAHIKILDPDSFPQSSVAPSEWKSLKEELRRHSQPFFTQGNSDWFGFLRMAFYMQILSSDKIIYQEDGIKFLKNEQSLEKAELIPERRRF
jgi:hypothetical protein